MKPVDLRNATWDSIQPLLQNARLRVLQAFRERGPMTTEQAATAIGMSILTLRPRTTELVQLGLVHLVDRTGTDGLYDAAPAHEARAAFERARAAAAPSASQLALL